MEKPITVKEAHYAINRLSLASRSTRYISSSIIEETDIRDADDTQANCFSRDLEDLYVSNLPRLIHHYTIPSKLLNGSFTASKGRTVRGVEGPKQG